jgi:hypothetical protein
MADEHLSDAFITSLGNPPVKAMRTEVEFSH